MRGGVKSSSFGIRVLDGLRCVDHADFFGGLGTLANCTPTSCVQLVHLRRTTRLLGRNRCAVARVTSGIKFSSTGCFHRMFGGCCKMDPDGCMRTRGVRSRSSRRS